MGKTVAFLVGAICLQLCVNFSKCVTFDDLKTEYTALYEAYRFNIINDIYGVYNTVIPRLDSLAPLDVSLQMKLYSISGFDAVSGSIELIGSLKLVWQDSVTAIAGVGQRLRVDYRRIWTPVIVLMNSADSVTSVGDTTYKVQFDSSTGEATWQPRVIANAACDPDVRYFPFDQQTCSLTFTPWFQDKDKIKLSVSSNEWDFLDYSENGIWIVEKTESAATLEGNSYQAVFTITVNRAPTYFLISIVFPILFVSLLSGCLFLLPAASGERLGFGMTCFLALVVLLQTLMQYMPRVSSPMSLLCYYVIVMIMFSATVIIVTILLLRLYNKPENERIPRWLVHVLEIIKCIKCKRVKCGKRSVVVPEDETSTSKQNGRIANKTSTKQNKSKPAADLPQTRLEKAREVDNNGQIEEVDWDTLGKLLDTFFFVVFLAVQGAVSFFFLLPIAARI